MSVDQWTLGTSEQGLSPGNRGLSYGDGLFETMRVLAGEIRFLDAHLARLSRGCERLGIPMPDKTVLAAHLVAQVHERVDWIKLILTRGESGRGYASDLSATPALIVSSGVLATTSPRWNITTCKTVLPDDSRLAGIKHLNRLTQVLARQEWQGDRYHEGIMCDTNGNAVCGIMSNVFIVGEQGVMTPGLQQSGVAGVMRQWVLGEIDVSVQRVNYQALFSAKEIFMTNALRGVISVRTMDGRALAQEAPVADRLRDALTKVTT